jgi:hypothetical protein
LKYKTEGVLEAQLGLNTPRRYLPPPDGTTTAAVRTAAAKNFSKITAPLGGEGNSHDEQKIPAYRITNTFYVVEKHLYTIKKSFYLLNLDEIRC